MNFFFKTILLFIIYLSFGYSSVFAHKGGINIGTRFDMATQAMNTVGPGGWIVVIASPGDCNTLQQIVTQAEGKNVNVIIRGHLNNKLTPNDAKGWVATLGNIKTSKMLYFMPWNEPNQEGNPDYGTPGDVNAYVDALIKNLNDAKLRGSKVFLLSPMINQSHGNFKGYIAALGGGAFYNKFDGIAMNLYDFGSLSYTPCQNGNPNMNVCRFGEVLAQMGTGKPAFGVESGTVLSGRVRYIEPSISTFTQKMIDEVNPTMFAVNAYDLGGEEGKKFNLFKTNAAKILKSYGSSHAGGATGNSFDETAFIKWLTPLQTNGDVVQCSNTCGFAPKENKGLCSASGSGATSKPFIPTRKITTSDTVTSVSDTVRLSQTSPSWPLGAVGITGVTKGGFFEEYQDITIPYAKNMTQFLAGPYAYQGNDAIKQLLNTNERDIFKMRPLVLNTPPELQDKLRHEYWQNCVNGTFCSSKNTGTPECPTKNSNECLISENNIEIQDLCPPPNAGFSDIPGYCPKTHDKWLDDSNDQQASHNWGSKWAEVPFFANSQTEVINSILMNTCPSPSFVGTTTKTKTPWVSALRDVSIFLNSMKTPKEMTQQVNLPKEKNITQNSPVLLASTSLLAEANPPTEESFRLEVSSSYSKPKVYTKVTFISTGCDGDIGLNLNGAQVAGLNGWNAKVPFTYGDDPKYTGSPFTVNPGSSITVTYTGYIQRGPRECGGKTQNITCTFTVDKDTEILGQTCNGGGVIMPPPQPTCAPPGIPNFIPTTDADPVYSEGHTLLKEDRTIGCAEWEIINGEPHCKTLKDQLKYNINDPLWAEVKYPFLSTIYNNLSSPNGFFLRQYTPLEKDTKDWNYAAESNVTYCLTDHPAPSMIKDGMLKIDTQTFVKENARCVDKEYTKGIRTFPSYIGGVFNAKEWVINNVLKPKNFSSQTQ